MADRYILLVEDNPDDEVLTIRALERGNIANDVVVAHDGEEALELLLADEGLVAERGLPSVTLLDLKLPKLDGFEILQRIRADERTWAMPVVVLTSSREEDDIITSYRNGANAFVRKPVRFSDFVDAVRTLGLFWLLVNEPPPSRRRG